MDYKGSENIIFYTMARMIGSVSIYRVVERISDDACTYSVFVTTLTGGALEESFASDLTANAEACIRLCEYLRDSLVTASSVADILADNIGVCEGSPPIFDEL